MSFRKIPKVSVLIFLAGLVLSFIVILPYFHKGYFPTHDGEWAVVRAAEMFREIRDHQFPPRYSTVLNLGYGYPLFNFEYPFPYYVSVLLHFLHFGFTNSIKTIFAVSVSFSYCGMFFLSLKFWKNTWAGFLSGIFYILLPYHLVDLYVRGSIGESIAFALYPLILLFCLFILEKKYIRFSISSVAILTAALVTAHNISAVYFGIIFAVYIMALLISRKYKEAILTASGFIWGLLISAFFFVPALLEKKYVKLSVIPIADRNLYYVSVRKLLFSGWGYGTPTDSAPFTYQIGLPQLTAFIISLVSSYRIKSVEKSIFLGFSLLLAIFILMMFPFAFFMWKVPVLSEINYPWTLLLPIGFLISFLSGAITELKFKKITSVALIIISIVLYLQFARPETYINKGDVYYMTNPATTTSSNELMPLWVKKEPEVAPAKEVIAKGDVSISKDSSNKISFRIDSQALQMISINKIYYPGWHAYVDGHEENISYGNKEGIMQINVPRGLHNIVLIFKETGTRFISDAVSLLSLIALIVFSGLGLLKFNYAKTKKKK